MCISQPKPPPPPKPAPPAVPPREMNTMSSPTPAAPGQSEDGTAVNSRRRGRRMLRIPLITSPEGSGVQVPS